MSALRGLPVYLLATTLFPAVIHAQAPPTPGPGGPQPMMVRRTSAPPVQSSGDTARVAGQKVSGIIVVPVQVNGKGTFRFAVDTGAMGQVSITNRAATQLALPVAGRSRMADPSGKNPIETNLYGVDSLKLGGVTFRGALAGALPDTLRRFEGVDGILGIALFTDFLLTFDYPRSELRLSRESLPDTNGRDILSFTREMGPIVVPLRIGNRLLPADVDTGNLIAPFVFPTAFVDSMPRRGEPRSGGTARTISNEVKIQVVTAAVPIRLGATVFENADVAYPALHERGNIGSKAFANSTLEIDQKNRRLRLRSSTAAGAGR